MAYNSMSLHPNHMIKGLSCRQEERLQIISLLLSMGLTYTCAIFKSTKHPQTLHQFCGSLYSSLTNEEPFKIHSSFMGLVKSSVGNETFSQHFHFSDPSDADTR